MKLPAYRSDNFAPLQRGQAIDVQEVCSVMPHLQTEADSMTICHAEPTISDLLSDPLIRSVMKADHVDPAALEVMLHTLAPSLRRVRQMPSSRKLPASARALGVSAW